MFLSVVIWVQNARLADFSPSVFEIWFPLLVVCIVPPKYSANLSCSLMAFWFFSPVVCKVSSWALMVEIALSCIWCRWVWFTLLGTWDCCYLLHRNTHILCVSSECGRLPCLPWGAPPALAGLAPHVSFVPISISTCLSLCCIPSFP